jgi:hypothetical protein
VEETLTEEQVLPETSTDEPITEEIVIETPTDEITEEILPETPTEEATDEILTEEQIVSETPMEESKPFPEENSED